MANNRSNKKRRNNRFIKDNYIAPYSPEVLSMSVEGLGLSDATLTSLHAAKIFFIKDLVIKRATDMYRIQNFGKRNLYELSDKLRTLGVDFRANEEKVIEPKDKTIETRDNQLNKKSNKNKKHNGNNQQVNNQQVSIKKEQKFKKGRPEDNAYNSQKLFPKASYKASAPIVIEKDSFIKMQRAGRWGFRDASGKEVIPPIYDEVFNFKEDFACVEKNGLFGFINRKNELIVPYKYECASSFSEGLACVTENGKCGFIDTDGQLVVPLEYDAATAFCEGVSRAKKDGKWGLLKKDGSFALI